MKEKWKPIPGYAGYYRVSSIGRVESIERKTTCRYKYVRRVPSIILNKNIGKNGYHVVTLYKKGTHKTVKVHRLVAAAFLGPSKLHVNHKDCDKTNNHVSNLEYVTVKENAQHARKHITFNVRRGNQCYNFKLTDKIKAEIRRLRGKLSTKEIGQRYGIHPYTCYKVWKNT